jgi:heme-degrading monooxygenase HmoA
MHAVVVRVTVSDREGAEQRLRDEVVPQVSRAPGFQAGYWTREGDSGLAMVIFDSEENARAGRACPHDHSRGRESGRRRGAGGRRLGIGGFAAERGRGGGTP